MTIIAANCRMGTPFINFSQKFILVLPMPSGRTHDRITLWSLPVVAGLTFGQTNSSRLTLLIAGSFLFSGLMFGPDLDIQKSYHIQRWGWLGWLWLPYQKSLHHRSFLSHGPLIGTAVRIIYLGMWMVLFGVPLIWLTQEVWEFEWSLSRVAKAILRSLSQESTEWLTIYCGLELGAMTHYMADWGASTYKRIQTQGLQGIFSGSVSKRVKASGGVGNIFSFWRSPKRLPKRKPKPQASRRKTATVSQKRSRRHSKD